MVNIVNSKCTVIEKGICHQNRLIIDSIGKDINPNTNRNGLRVYNCVWGWILFKCKYASKVRFSNGARYINTSSLEKCLNRRGDFQSHNSFEMRINNVIDTVESKLLDKSKPDLLSSPPFQRVFSQFQGFRYHAATSIAIWLLKIAKPEEVRFIPEAVLSTKSLLDNFLRKNDVDANGNSTELLQIAATHFFEQVLKLEKDSRDSAVAIGEELLNRLSENNHMYFHGTHFCHLESIKKHGLSIHHAGKNPRADKINKIAKEVLDSNLLSFGFRYKNCQSENQTCNIFGANYPFVAVEYALCAPEWFSYFAGHEAFIARDKHQARERVTKEIARLQTDDAQREGKRKLTDQEAQEIRDYFEEEWENFKIMQPIIIFFKVIPKGMTENELIEDEKRAFKSVFNFQSLNSLDDVQAKIRSLIYYSTSSHDKKFTESIPAENITYYQLPVQ